MSKDARTLACAYYAAAGRSLQDDIAALSSHEQGVFLYSPQLVALMRSTSRHDSAPWLHLDTRQTDVDTWYIHLLVGDVRLAQSLGAMLEPLPWLCFQRGLRHPRLHVWPWKSFLRHLKHLN